MYYNLHYVQYYYDLLDFAHIIVGTLNSSLQLPVRFPQITVCTANLHTLPLVGTSVQVTVMLVVVVGQLPQLDDRML